MNSLVSRIDDWLIDIGTRSLIDGDKVRDMLLDLRLMAAETEAEWFLTTQPVN